jgi:hypothetical protein
MRYYGHSVMSFRGNILFRIRDNRLQLLAALPYILIGKNFKRKGEKKVGVVGGALEDVLFEVRG